MQEMGSVERDSQATRTPRAGAEASQYEDLMRSYGGTSGTVEGDFVPVTLPVEFSDDPHAIYSFFHGEGFELTGENQADFEEVQRHFLWQ